MGDVIQFTTVVRAKSEDTHYKAKYTALICFDARKRHLYDKFREQNGLAETDIDIISTAGGAKKLASPGHDYERLAVFDDIYDSISLHDPDKIILMVHQGCGKYAKKFDNPDLEREFYLAELNKAADVLEEFLRSKSIEKDIILHYASFEEGLHEVERVRELEAA